MSQDHDSRYKMLFSSPRLVKELLQSFVPEPWVYQVDYEKAENVSSAFISEGFSLRESDLIWKLPFNDRTVYLFLLMEFQSTVDRYMALRVCRYILEFYEKLLKQEPQSRKKLLPAVFPLVLYNGDEKWNAAECLEEMIEPVIDSRYLPRFRYFKLAENEISQGNLDALHNLISVLFQVETLDPDLVGQKAAELVAKLSGEDKRDILTFIHWLEHYYGEKDHPLKDVMDPLKEVQSMLETKLKHKEEEWVARGRQEGRQEERLEMARRMKSKGVSISDIALFTGLTEEEIKKL